MSRYEQVQLELRQSPKRWLVTGVAGFIGSNLLEALLQLDQTVVGLDNYSTGKPQKLQDVQYSVTAAHWVRFRMFEGDLHDLETCQRACEGVDYVLHQAALGSVSRSIENPIASHACNATGFVNLIATAKECGARRLVYASSSSVYGDDPRLPKVEENIGHCLSPYAVTKRAGELYAGVFARCYGFESIGLRYFNVFGPRQDPDGPYAAVIPRWIAAMIKGQPVHINGDGESSRDFCYVANVVQANVLAATAPRLDEVDPVCNVAVGGRTSLNRLFHLLKDRLISRYPRVETLEPTYRDFRAGDVRHSQADISKARRLLGYEPTHDIEQGLDEALDWYLAHLAVEPEECAKV